MKYFKHIMLIVCLLSIGMTGMQAQSMSDDQVIKYVMKEQQKGSSQQEIVTKLMQKGVNIDQIRRVQKKAERLKKNQGLGTVSNSTTGTDGIMDPRMRINNGDTGKMLDEDDNSVTGRLKSDRLKQGTAVSTVTKKRRKSMLLDDEEAKSMKSTLDEFMPDSLDIYDQQVIRNYLKKKAEMEGQLDKKVFGRNIFNNEDLTFEPAMNIATPSNYVLGPGDKVFVDISGATQKTIETTVSPDGFVTIEDYGVVDVAGQTVAQASTTLRQKLGARYSSSQIRLSVGQTRTITVHVMGEVKMPGSYTLSAFASVFHALYQAGGPNELGTLRSIKVYRDHQLISTVDVYDYILNGELKGNVRLSDNDVIMVGAYDCLVNITGKVKRPMFYEMKKTENLGTLIGYAGGFAGDAYRKSVRVVRKAGTQYSVHNIGEFDMADFRLADEDSVSVDSILPRFSNMVEIKGAVFRPGMYQLGKNVSTVKELLEQAEGVNEDAFTAHAVMHRMKQDRTLQVVPVDIQGILDGRVQDIALQNEDVLFVPTRREARMEQVIKIHGEVMYPGTYKYADNETLEDFVLQAGGLTEAGSMANVMVARRIIDPNATQTDTLSAQTFNFSLKDGFVIDGEPGFHLKPFDEVFVRRSPAYLEQQNVSVEGEVLFQGSYSISLRNERLSDLVKKAGGPTDLADIEGARLVRKMNEAERMRYEEMLAAEKREKDNEILRQAIKAGRGLPENLKAKQEEEEQEALEEELPEVYYVAIDLKKALEKPGSEYDVVLREGDRLVVPQTDNTVKISGHVNHPNAITFKDGKSAKWYIKHAGGVDTRGKKNKAYIIYKNGDVALAKNGDVRPGCEIVVPLKGDPKFSTTEVTTIGSALASLSMMIVTLYNVLK